MNVKIKILLIGKTGAGKSSLANFLLGQKDVFQVYDTQKYGTQDTMMIERNGLVIVDTPGLLNWENNSSYDKDAEHYKELIKYIKKIKELNIILIVMKCHETRYSSDIKTMIKMICNIFEYRTFKNIGFVFTNYYGKKSEKEKIRKNKQEFVEQSKKIIEDFYGKKLENNLPYFFIDSDLDEPDDDSLIEREKILLWAKSLPLFCARELDEKDARYKKMYYDYDYETRITEDFGLRYKENIVYQTKKAIDLDNNVIIIENKKEIKRIINK